MAAVIDGGAVDEDQVLVDAAAPDAEPGGSLARGLHPRHHLDDADDVVLAHQGGHFLHEGRIDPFQAHLRQLDLLPLGAREDGGGLQFAAVGLQVEIQLGRFRQLQRSLFRHVAEVGAIDGMLSRGNVQRIEADGVRGHARLPVFQEDDRLGEWFPALRVADVAGKDDRPGLGQSRQGHERQEGRSEDAPEGNHLSVRAFAADCPAR